MGSLRPRIHVRFDTSRRGLRDRDLTGPAELALRREGFRAFRLDVLATDDRGIARIHHERMGLSHPTDVLSFQLPWEPGDPPGGDNAAIVVSIETAAREARRRGLHLRDEVGLYAMHGVLHAVGWDDGTASDRNRMHARTAELLREMGLCTDVHQRPGASARRALGRRAGRLA